MRAGWRWGLLGVAAVALLVALLWRHELAAPAAVRVMVGGGDGGGLPIAQPSEEHFNAAALERVINDPAAAGLQAFIVMRHGHVVFSRYGHGLNADTRIDSGPLARVLVALLAGVALRQEALPPAILSRFDPNELRAAIERGTHQPYAQYLSHKLWSRLNAAPAWIELPAKGAAAPADCCFVARVQDWMRIGGLLVGDGSFEDTQVIDKGWIARMRRPSSADGREGLGVELMPASRRTFFNARDTFFVRGPSHWRLWAVPSLQLAVLFGAPAPPSAAGTDSDRGDSDWDETRLLNLVIDALTDQPAAQRAGSLLQQLVPGH